MANQTDRLRAAIYTQIDCALEEGSLTTSAARRWESRTDLATTDGELAEVCYALTDALWS